MVPSIFMFLVIMAATARAQVSVQRGDFSEIDSSTAIARMTGDSTGMWFQLINETKHPEAFLRYMVLGPSSLTGIVQDNITVPEFWTMKDRAELTGRGSLQQSIGRASISEYSTTTDVKDIGRLQISITTLVFQCLEEDCSSFTPMVLNSSEIYTLWKELYVSSNRSITVNAIPADLVGEGYEKTLRSSGFDNLRLRTNGMFIQDCDAEADSMVLINAAESISRIASLIGDPTIMRLYPFRTALEGAYPWQSVDGCYQLNLTALQELGDKVGIDFGNVGDKLFVMGFSASLGGLVHDILVSSLKIALEVSKRVSISECHAGSRMLFNNIGGGIFTVCSAANATGLARCMIFSYDVNTTSFCDRKSFEIIQAIKSSSSDLRARTKQIFRDCIQMKEKPVPTFPRTINITVTNAMASNRSKLCKRRMAVTVNENILNLLHIGIRNSYVEQHKSVFDADRGGSTDFLPALLTIVASFLSMIGATGPLTTFQVLLLKKFKYIGPILKFKTAKLVMLTSTNTILAFFFYIPVILLARDEFQRSKEYKTWGLVSRDFGMVVPHSRVLLVISGSSVYDSKIMAIAWVLGALSPPLVAIITVNKFRKKLLQIKAAEKECENSNVSNTQGVLLPNEASCRQKSWIARGLYVRDRCQALSS